MTYENLTEWKTHCKMQWTAMLERKARELATNAYAPIGCECGNGYDVIEGIDLGCRERCSFCGATRACDDA